MWIRLLRPSSIISSSLLDRLFFFFFFFSSCSSSLSSPSSSSSSSFHPFFLVRNYADPTSSVLRFLVPPGRKANFSANQAGQASKINVGTPRMEPIDVVFRDVPVGQVSIRSLRKQTRLSINCCLVFTRRKDFFSPPPGQGKLILLYRVS